MEVVKSAKNVIFSIYPTKTFSCSLGRLGGLEIAAGGPTMAAGLLGGLPEGWSDGGRGQGECQPVNEMDFANRSTSPP